MSDILARFCKFVRGLRSSPSMEVAVLCGVVSGDVQTTTGSNLNLLRFETGLNTMTCSMATVKEYLGQKLAAVPDTDLWRVPFLEKLLQARGDAYYCCLETDDLTSLVDSLCCN